MRERNRKPIASCCKFPQFTTMNVIDGQAVIERKFSLIFYSLTVDNILNMIILLILAGITLSLILGNQSLLGRTQLASNTMAEATRNEMTMMNEYEETIVEKTQSRLADEYQEVEYLRSSGEQYIDTKYYANPEMKFYIRFQYYEKAGGYARLFGSRASGSYGNLFNCRTVNPNINIGTDNGLYLEDCGRRSYLFNYDANEHIMICDAINQWIYLDNVKVVNSFCIDKNVIGSLFLFATNAGGYNDGAHAKIYECKIYNNEVLEREFIPCYCVKTVTDVNGKICEVGTAGLYDIVEEKFYTNQGTGAFVKGPVV